MIERLATAVRVHEIGLQAALDIFVLAFIIYQLLLLVRGTRAVPVMTGVVTLAALHFATRPGLLHLPAVHALLGYLIGFIPLAAVVLFQNQIRQALARFGRNPFTTFVPKRREQGLLAEEISLAAASLASKRYGAIIVIERELGLRAFYETGIPLDAIVSYDLLLNIFTRGSPLHDGAAIIAEGRVKAASCWLPLTTDPSLSRTYGTRHRAAIGITEESDAVAVVVSEERGVISVAEGGRIEEGWTAQELGERLRRALAARTAPRWRRALRVRLPLAS
jgi:uncharacterized protein (TIGR00159 family)